LERLRASVTVPVRPRVFNVGWRNVDAFHLSTV
jgi:hypothetical protein